MAYKHTAPSPDHKQKSETGTTDGPQKAMEETLRNNEAHLQAVLRRAESNYAKFERTQSQLRAIIDASQEAILLLTPDGRPIRVNRSFSDFFGLDDTTVLSQTSEQLMALLRGLFKASDSLERWLAWSTADQQHTFLEPQVQVASSPRVFALSSLPVKDVHQTYLGRLYVWYDVTHELEVERMKSDFVSTVSHELRTPLTSIKGYTDVLLTDETLGELTELQREFLAIIQNNVGRLESLVFDLLDLSHLESGMMELHLEALNINLLISELMPSFQPAWDKKRQTFTLHLSDDVPVVLGDSKRVTQILTNLLSNAHKYTPEGGYIDLTVETIETVASIVVTDSGIGLSTEEQTRLFTRFYRAHNAATEEIGGTGLGLSIARTLARMQRGEIQVESTPGHGSTFRFTLPLI
jgi:signal transduction histidine kinase